VTAPQGFTASGVCAEIKKADKRDIAVIFAGKRCKAAGVFTTNRVQAACVQYSRQVLADGYARAVVANSGNANACTGAQGLADARRMAQVAARELHIEPTDVVVASTGVIGVPLPMERVEAGIVEACRTLSAAGADLAAQAIMTTDTVDKQVAVEFELAGQAVRIGGMAKGSGMIHPNMATMLAFLTTDANISLECLNRALRESVNLSFNMISVDRDTSTNDCVVIIANGLAGHPQIEDPDSPEYRLFRQALDHVNVTLAKKIARDGEGATRLIEVEVLGAHDQQAARLVARAVTASNLFKAAVFGEDANWGRIICAAGYSGADFDPARVDIFLGPVQVARAGMGVEFDEDAARAALRQDTVKVRLQLNQGQGRAVAWGCDLTHAYIDINAAYRS
jgi:glutamate N-acetyltransferase/amino-acid N-acetyltransferase